MVLRFSVFNDNLFLYSCPIFDKKKCIVLWFVDDCVFCTISSNFKKWNSLLAYYCPVFNKDSSLCGLLDVMDAACCMHTGTARGSPLALACGAWLPWRHSTSLRTVDLKPADQRAPWWPCMDQDATASAILTPNRCCFILDQVVFVTCARIQQVNADF